MNEAIFWAMVQRAHDAAGTDMDAKCVLIKAEISGLSIPDACEFARLFDSMMGRAYTHALWGAAYVINGGCGDDTFSDFRTALISRGRDSFNRALSDPDSLADEPFDQAAWFHEGYQYAISEGVAAVGAAAPRASHPDEPSGEAWSDETVYALYPRLSARFA